MPFLGPVFTYKLLYHVLRVNLHNRMHQNMINITHIQKFSNDFSLQRKSNFSVEKRLILEGFNFLEHVVNILGLSVPEMTKVKKRIVEVSMEQIKETLQ
jgi:hypothetical protein